MKGADARSSVISWPGKIYHLQKDKPEPNHDCHHPSSPHTSSITTLQKRQGKWPHIGPLIVVLNDGDFEKKEERTECVAVSRGYASVGSLDSDTMEIEGLQSERDDFAELAQNGRKNGHLFGCFDCSTVANTACKRM